MNSGALSLHILKWGILLFIDFPQHWSPKKIDLSFSVASLLVTSFGGFCWMGLITSFFTLQATQYTGKIIYMLICAIAGIFFAVMYTLFPNFRNFAERLPEKCHDIFYACFISTIVAVCAVFILFSSLIIHL